MKYIALLAVLLLMGWTWQMAQADRGFGLAETREMEAQIESIIQEHIRAERPNVKSVTFQQLYTEVVETGSLVQVHARYTIEEPAAGNESTKQVMEGLIKLKSSDGVNWVFAGQELKSPALEFQEGIRIESEQKTSEAE